LQWIEPGIESLNVMVVLDVGPIVSQPPNGACQRRIVCRNGTTISEGTQILPRIKTETGSMPKRSNSFAFEPCTVSLGRVFYKQESVSIGDGCDRIHIRGLTIQVDRYDGARPRGYGLGNKSGIEVVSAFVRIDGDRYCSSVRHREPRGNVGVRRHYDFVAGTDSSGAKDQMKGIETIGNSDAMLGTAIGGKFLFECLNLFAKHIPARRHDAVECCVKFIADFAVRRTHIQKRYRHL
jgi:hypothetical protein